MIKDHRKLLFFITVPNYAGMDKLLYERIHTGDISITVPVCFYRFSLEVVIICCSVPYPLVYSIVPCCGYVLSGSSLMGGKYASERGGEVRGTPVSG